MNAQLSPIRQERLCLLITVYHPYRWTAPFTWQMIRRFWPDHPPVYFCGLTSEEAGELPHIPVKNPGLPRIWADFAHDAALRLRDEGFEAAYFFLEDHMPLDRCHSENLTNLLPSLLNSLPASYIGLMGWDNRRFATRSGPLISKDQYRLRHLVTERAPRFHLHPSLFRMDALLSCLEALTEHDKPNPWGFEKLSDKPDAPIPEKFKQNCYQIHGSELALQKPGVGGKIVSTLERWFYHRMMSLVPLARKLGCGDRFFKAVGFDNFFYNGPFPMFYSGVMAGGRVNEHFVRYLENRNEPFFRELIIAAKERMH
jgi:hypothetical protein